MGDSFPTVVVPAPDSSIRGQASAGTHFDLDGRNMDSRFRGNDDMKNPRVTHFRNSQ
jgi:hypothetical protein